MGQADDGKTERIEPPHKHEGHNATLEPEETASAETKEIAAQFVACLQRSQEYPLTVLRTDIFWHTQNSFQTRLIQDGLFDGSKKKLYVRDLHEDNTTYDQGRLLGTIEDMETLLDPGQKDPWWRFMSVPDLLTGNKPSSDY